ncbi:MAG: hypothetical protein AAGA63_08595 [Pseudomonadota bacterium]
MEHPAKPIFRLGDAAAKGRLLLYKCNLCRRATYFLASDLAQIYDPEIEFDSPLFACSRCNRHDYINVRIHVPHPGDYGSLTVKRPGPIKTIQTWRMVKLGDV